MSDAFVIETARHTAGIAVRERGGFRFYASEARFLPLDSRLFRSLGAVRAAADEVAAPIPPKQTRTARAAAALMGDLP
ncbi:MAG TPA: hypothetical protein VMC10_04320 [Stellaceae bacterium]|nr:hypothetical protein [Stellaceae bacterium]